MVTPMPISLAPAPRNAPARRPELQVVPKQGRRLRTGPTVLLGGLLAFAIAFALVVAQALLVQGQQRLDDLGTSVAEADRHQQELRLQVAQLESPTRIVAAATNDLGLCPPVDPTVRQFHDRDIRVLDAERFTVALTSAITDPQVRALLDRVGLRRGEAVGRLPGTIDQAVDSTDVLTDTARFRAAAPMLGLS